MTTPSGTGAGRKGRGSDSGMLAVADARTPRTLYGRPRARPQPLGDAYTPSRPDHNTTPSNVNHDWLNEYALQLSSPTQFRAASPQRDVLVLASDADTAHYNPMRSPRVATAAIDAEPAAARHSTIRALVDTTVVPAFVQIRAKRDSQLARSLALAARRGETNSS